MQTKACLGLEQPPTLFTRHDAYRQPFPSPPFLLHLVLVSDTSKIQPSFSFYFASRAPTTLTHASTSPGYILAHEPRRK